ncbi:uncharacterized protein [Eurosta solidaginis]|uniref:uncharacterized protein n=1 Tax=Eurosta solidaginis TaxID=178769 RepID=UPI003530961B
MKCLVILLLFGALLVNAYDFDDSAFNEHIFNEWQSLTAENEADSLIHRSRRDASSESNESHENQCQSYRKDMHCCKGGNVKSDQMEIFKNAKKECITEIRGDVAGDFFDPFNCDVMKQVKEKVICVSECVAKKYKGVSDAGEFQKDHIVEHLKIQIGDAQWKLDAVEGYVDKCIAEVKKRKEEREKEGKPNKTSQGCSLDPLTFQRCMWREYWTGCPVDQRVDTPKCKKLHERVAEGNIGFFGKHFLHKYYLDN